jgi:kynureninase
MKTSAELDAEDTLASLRQNFVLPVEKTYLDGNSLGPLSHKVSDQLAIVTKEQWAEDLISGWNTHQWIDLPLSVGNQLAPILGAQPGEVICCDNLSINLFKCLAAALELNAPRRKILTEAHHFPTDNYIAQGLSQLLGESRCEVQTAALEDLDRIDLQDVAVVSLSHVNFKTGELRDMPRITKQAHEAGCLIVWDLAHSAGVVDMSLTESQVDMAVGCTYKFLNAGPGAPGFLFMARRHQHVGVALQGWMGHADGFAFESRYRPASGIARFLTGTQSVLAMVAVAAALDIFESVSISDIRHKSLALTDHFLDHLASSEWTRKLEVLTPRDHALRGSQVSLAIDHAYPVSQALIDRGVIVDFREPNIVRFGFSPLYNQFSEAERAAEILSKILANDWFLGPAYNQRHKVT